MAVDHEGNVVSLGEDLWVPVTVQGIEPNGTLTVKTAYSLAVVSGVPSIDTHKGGGPTWPGTP